MKIACLSATNRPSWRTWLLHQYEKQTWPHRELFIDDSDDLIPVKRTRLLQQARRAGVDAVAWFDDDDWSAPDRLQTYAECFLRSDVPLGAVGNVRSYFVSTEGAGGAVTYPPGSAYDPAQATVTRVSPMAISYQAPEGIIFNGAVFLLSKCPPNFSKALHTGEDTDWLLRWHRRRPSYFIVPGHLHLWLCHRRNVTNRVDNRSFTEVLPPGLITEEEWKLIPH